MRDDHKTDGRNVADHATSIQFHRHNAVAHLFRLIDLIPSDLSEELTKEINREIESAIDEIALMGTPAEEIIDICKRAAKRNKD